MEKRPALTNVDILAGVPVDDDDMIGLLRTLQSAIPPAPSMAIGIVATNAGEGVSTIVRGLARAAWQRCTLKVLICDVLTSAPALSSISPSERLAIGSRSLKDVDANKAITWLPNSNIGVATLADFCCINGASHASVIQTIESLKARFDLVILDLPPAGRVVPPPSLAKALDGIVLVVEAERTRSHAIQAARQSIQASGGRILGVVLNKRRFHVPRSIYERI